MLVGILTFILGVTYISSGLRVKRGFGNSSGGGGYAPGYGSGPAGQAAGRAALGVINDNQNVALWSAQSAVAAAVGRDYQNQLATTSQFTNAFTVPVTKSQAAEAFRGVSNQQHGSMISGALAGNTVGNRGRGHQQMRHNNNRGSSRGHSMGWHGGGRGMQNQWVGRHRLNNGNGGRNHQCRHRC